jgi:hypothetical protein
VPGESEGRAGPEPGRRSTANPEPAPEHSREAEPMTEPAPNVEPGPPRHSGGDRKTGVVRSAVLSPSRGRDRRMAPSPRTAIRSSRSSSRVDARRARPPPSCDAGYESGGSAARALRRWRSCPAGWSQLRAFSRRADQAGRSVRPPGKGSWAAGVPPPPQ